MTGTTYKGIANRRYTPDKRIGGGGEGEVFTVREDPGLVVKLYKETPGPDKTDKLRHMVTLANDELLRFAAWPLDVVYDNGGRLCGFTMHKLQGYLPLHMLFTPMDRKKLFPDKGYNFLAHVARNLAVAFHKIHQMGIVVGDVNEANLLVSKTGMVALIDCDSFQIKNGQRYHFCEVGMLRYTPPELLRRGSFAHVVRTANTDVFSLATLIFQLLFLGRAPFTGINPGKQELDEDTAIKDHEFAYSLRKTNKRLFPAKNSLELSAMPFSVSDAFHKAFEQDDGRPTALHWATLLGEMIKDLAPCNVSKLHFYPAKMGRCPWCAFKQHANIYYFLDDGEMHTPLQLASIEQFINGFRFEPLQVAHLPGAYYDQAVKAQKIPARFYRVRYLSFLPVMLVTAIILYLATHGIASYSVLIPLAIGIIRAGLPATGVVKSELTARRDAFNRVKAPFDKIVGQHNNPTALKQYNTAVSTLKNSFAALRGLPAEFGRTRRDIEEKYYQVQYTQHLRQFNIQASPITGFGPAKKKLIADHGIRSAGDITRLKQIKIPGIGPKNQQVLFDWQRQIGSGFTYQPDAASINHEARIASEAIFGKRKKLENDIRIQHKVLTDLRINILNSLKTLEEQHRQLRPQVARAYAELEAFEKLAGWKVLRWKN